jgi:hypothetical protein
MAQVPATTPVSADESTVREIIRELFKELAPVFRDINKPYEDPEKARRTKYERENFRAQEREREAGIAALQAACPHKDSKSQKFTISLQHNFHDNMVRGICNRCGLIINPAYRDYRPETQPDGRIVNKVIVVKEHTLYPLVQQLDASE